MKFNIVLIRFVVLIFVLLTAVSGAWLWWHDAIASVDPTDETPIQFVVKKGDDVRSIANDLASQKLIRSSTGFYLTVKLLGIEKNIQAGNFRLKKSFTAEQTANTLTKGIVDAWVQTLEGWRVEEVATKLAKELDIPEKEFLKYAREGYMFPDTYMVPQDASAAAIAKIFEDNLTKKLTPLQSDIAASKLTLEQILTLASIVEREGVNDTDRPLIAGVLLKRLDIGMPLQTDATVQYAVGYQAQGKTWWKKELTLDDLKIKSPYNTYEVAGLPPGPICNPGIKSITAVLRAQKTDNLYYIHDTKGQVYFAKTVEEHNANIAKYLK